MAINENWEIYDNELSVSDNQTIESILTVGNGYFGMRGAYEDDAISEKSTTHGAYINGFYETAPITYGEQAHGYPSERQSMISLPDASHISLQLDGIPVDHNHGEITDNIRDLSMKTGLMTHKFVWTGKLSGKKIQVSFRRIVSHVRKHIFAIQMTVKPVNFKRGILSIKSTIDSDNLSAHSSDDPRVSEINTDEIMKHARQINTQNDQIIGLSFTTQRSDLSAMVGAIHNLDGKVSNNQKIWQSQILIDQQPVRMEKFACYFDTRESHGESVSETVVAELEKSKEAGFDALRKEQANYMRLFWHDSDIHIATNYHDDLQMASRFALFQLLQSVGKDGKRGISAKGLSSTGYDGHYFWDTEIYIIPFFTMTQPQIAKSLLTNRYNQLSHATEHAMDLGYRGALFPWRTINGEESSAYFPASTAAVHINADIMFALQQYYYFTDDEHFMRQYGLKMLVEASRFYLSYGSWDKEKGFVINTVTGPDEYTALVNNNSYTNLMVKNQLEFLTTSFDLSQVARFGVTEKEWQQFEMAAKQMFIPREDNLIGQDDSFLSKPKLDLKTMDKSKFPLLMHYHPLFLYQHQVLKQADLILAMALMPYRFTNEQQKINYEYYEPLTTHDSSLSRCAYAIAASRLPDQDAFDQMLQSSFKTDLTDSQNNTANGIHTASMGGIWLVILLGLAHVQATENKLILDPIMPPSWNAYVVCIQYHGSQIKLSVSERGSHVTLMHGLPIKVQLNGEIVQF
ncbi:glycosyl hydrolase family 65 protein [Paucilactobacillus suebicus]|uniref:Glycoside hydrolase n=1 Tax=Paucilactobacillus suebicus DSM 5007 = KCTC 3549 TaxID=1423807 RepID=A0A0R1W4V7_9LACO|nr:glycosyl hydrolase family 65 protein [Paucilactobacillus suebicus]KRM12824.1 glycoside hydrolase [Paucilactobacillus suebicus DSM 5007 = KCTC 3549]